MTLLRTLIIGATGVGGQPDPNGLPGTSALESLISGVAFWALLAALAGLLLSAMVWALSSHSGNYQHATMGRRGTLISAHGDASSASMLVVTPNRDRGGDRMVARAAAPERAPPARAATRPGARRSSRRTGRR